MDTAINCLGRFTLLTLVRLSRRACPVITGRSSAVPTLGGGNTDISAGHIRRAFPPPGQFPCHFYIVYPLSLPPSANLQQKAI